MQNDIPTQRAPSGAIQTQWIEAWVPDHSDPDAGRPWKPESAGVGAFARAQMTDAVTCEPVSLNPPSLLRDE